MCEYNTRVFTVMMSPGKVQISRFCDTDNCTDVVTKGVNGLNINANPKFLKLLVSVGLTIR